MAIVGVVIAHSRQFEMYNISTGMGTRLIELTHAVSRLLNKDIRLVVGERRPHDLNYNVLNNKKAKSMLGWAPEYRLEDGLREFLKAFRFE